VTISLDRRLAELEDRFAPPKPRLVVLVVGMAREGGAWEPLAFSLPGGVRIDRAAAESPDEFRARVQADALAASSAPVVVVVAVGGQDVSETIVQRWPAASQGEQP
jgi:hypothetical protein